MEAVRLEPTVVLLTANDTEREEVLRAFGSDPRTLSPESPNGLPYWRLGVVGGCAVCVVQCQQASGTPGGSQETVRQAIDAFAPSAVIAVGTAYGLQRRRGQRLGHVLISDKVACYEHQKLTDEGQRLIRGARPACQPGLLRVFRAGSSGWGGPTCHVGLIVSAEKLASFEDFVSQVLEDEPEAVGGEMEGTGLHTAALSGRVDWILVKGISDWGVNKTKTKRPAAAARNAARLVHHVISQRLMAGLYGAPQVFWPSGTPAVAGVETDDGRTRPMAIEAPRRDPKAYPPGPGEWRQTGRQAGEVIGGPGHTHPTMVWVPAGEFRMGCPEASLDAYPNEAPEHSVRMSRGFWLGRCLVTNAAYAGYLNERERIRGDSGLDSLADDGNYWAEVRRVGGKWVVCGGRDKYPVIGADWYSARAYAAWYGLRLPNEAEWEYAARGPDSRVYPWEGEWDPEKCCHAEAPGPPWMCSAARYDRVANPDANMKYRLMEGATHTEPVDAHPDGASWCKALDMSGNQMEWCEDVPRRYPPDGSKQVDPVGPAPAPGTHRAVKGGNCFHGQDECRASCRKNATYPYYMNNSISFRCAYTPVGQK